MMKRRMEYLRVLQEHGYDIGHREKMCFLYWNFALQSGMDAEEAKHAAIRFNKRFEHTMVEKDAAIAKVLRVKGMTISQIAKELNVSVSTVKRYLAKKVKR